MSIVELPDTSSGSLMRTPPQDLAAEQSVLGGMLLSKDAIADVVEVVRGQYTVRARRGFVATP